MSKLDSFFETVQDIVSYGESKGILKLYTENDSLNDNMLILNGRRVADFGSCSYLGLQFDSRIKKASIQAVEQYGTQFSASRVYVSSRHYLELESKLETVFGYPTLVGQTTTLCHIAAIPVLFSDSDAVILDHQVHNSVQNAVNLLKFRKVHVEMIRHNRMDLLEDMVKGLRSKFKRIWYMADGIYSMYGDESPVDAIYALMDKYPELHYYVDDAHGMSCFGEHGRGSVLNQRPLHPKCILVTSFAKAFPTGGAALVFPDRSMLQKVRNSGGPFLSSGPLQPAQLGAAIACADIHLSDEIYQLQKELQEKISFTNKMLTKYQMPSVSENRSPIFFVGVGLPKMGNAMIRRLLDEGYYTNLGVFPTVPMKNTGVRFTITRLNTEEQIEGMISAMAKHYPLALEETGFEMQKVYRAFRMEPPRDSVIEKKQTAGGMEKDGLQVQKFTSIRDIDRTEWDQYLGGRGSFDWKGLQLLENSFSNNEGRGQTWDFDYLIIKDETGKVVLATFFTTTLAKDDMLASSSVSEDVEKKRKTDHDFLVSKLTTMGSLLTEGNHMYLDEKHPQKKVVMELFFRELAHIQEARKASLVHVRDMVSTTELDHLFADHGFFKMQMPSNFILDQLEWKGEADFVDRLSKKGRYNLRHDVIKKSKHFTVRIPVVISGDQIRNWYHLYKQVKNRSLEINTFDLPFRLFENFAIHQEWDKLELCLEGSDKASAVVFSHKGRRVYSPVVIGMDYAVDPNLYLYRQMLYQVIKRAGELGMQQVRFGFTADIEKRKLGAQAWQPVAYVNAIDNYNLEALGSLALPQKNH
ncbi:MAG: aminotransferase class I/II-fold pyridoxal phosphate-dependent enzyme [Flavobacteriales bacterium]|nr:aminotransferase class I/II-fold pyridoxal phosphate-dependent enzyme [Flavobacteriales bacterium]MCB9447959.1 aminotransferase class I/II-fold pyridoxal phosphate-dependent enzyme [Flavobacteriales bacterium]